MIFIQNLMIFIQNLVIFSQNLVIFSQNLMLSSQNLSVKPVGLYQFASYYQNLFCLKKWFSQEFYNFSSIVFKINFKGYLAKYLMIQIYPNIWQFSE